MGKQPSATSFHTARWCLYHPIRVLTSPFSLVNLHGLGHYSMLSIVWCLIFYRSSSIFCRHMMSLGCLLGFQPPDWTALILLDPLSSFQADDLIQFTDYLDLLIRRFFCNLMACCVFLLLFHYSSLCFSFIAGKFLFNCYWQRLSSHTINGYRSIINSVCRDYELWRDLSISEFLSQLKINLYSAL